MHISKLKYKSMLADMRAGISPGAVVSSRRDLLTQTLARLCPEESSARLWEVRLSIEALLLSELFNDWLVLQAENPVLERLRKDAVAVISGIPERSATLSAAQAAALKYLSTQPGYTEYRKALGLPPEEDTP